MSSEGIAQQAPGAGWPDGAADTAPEQAAAPPQSFSQQVMSMVLRRWGARLGLLWIGVLVLAAVFAPFLANSHPLIMQTADGEWSSPMLKHLTAPDVTLLMAFGAAVVLVFVRGLKFRQKGAVLLWIVAVTIPLTSWPTAEDHWREWLRDWGPAMFWGGGIALAAALTAAIVLVPLLARVPLRAKLLMGGAGAALVVLFTLAYPVRPPATVVFAQYREMERADRIQYALSAPIPYSPTDRLRDMPERRLSAPNRDHWLGTEQHGADVASRMIHATRIALSIGFIATGIALVIGVTIGGFMGYFVRYVDLLGMRLVEIFEAIPTLLLLITFVAFFGRNLYLMMAIIGLTSWTGYARYIRAEFLKLRRQDFVQAAIAAGLPLRSVLFRHMLPNGMAPVLVSASFGVASAILAESTLSFLGLGLVDEPSWGQMLNQVRAVGTFQWWIAMFPGMAIFLTVFAYNLVGEALRDAIDPKTRRLR